MGPRKSATGSEAGGFTFVEVMVALVVLCGGIVLIYKSFFLCTDYLNNLSCRLLASSLVDEKIGDVAQAFAQWPAKSLYLGEEAVTVDVNYKPVRFHYDIDLRPLADVKSVWQLKVGLSWVEAQRNMRISRSAYMMR